MTKLIVTGATGVIGHAVLESCLLRRQEVYVIVNPKSLRKKNLPHDPLIHILEFDLSELKFAADVIPHTCDVFYHLGWSGSAAAYRNNVYMQTANIQYTLEAVKLAQVCGCHTFIGAGSQAEYGRAEGALNEETPVFPEVGYGVAKLCAGQMSRLLAHQLGMKHIWARILSVYGPYDGENTLIMYLLRTLLHRQKPACTKGEQIWDYVYAKDVANILTALGEEKSVDGKIYCIGSGQAKPLKDYMKTIRDLIDPSLPLGLGEIPYSERQVQYLLADTTAIKNDLGYTMQYSFQEGMKETLNWYKEKLQNRNRHDR